MKELGKHGHKFLVMGLGFLIILLIIYMHVRNKEGFAPPRRPGVVNVDLENAAGKSGTSLSTIAKACNGQPPSADTLGTKGDVANCYNQKKQTLVSCDGTTGKWQWSCVNR